MWKSILLGILSLPLLCVGAETSLVDLLKSQGFECKSREHGTLCTIKSINKDGFIYSQPVAILVPNGLKKPSRMLMHLHGFKGVCESLRASPNEMVNEFRLMEQMNAANASNSVMVFPMSRNKCDTYKQELVPRFKKFHNWINSLLNLKDEHWLFSGHSGAGSPMARILGQNPDFAKKVDATFLMDATYGMPNYVGDWKKALAVNPKMTIQSTYRPGTATAQGTSILKSAVGNRLTIESTSTSHCAIPRVTYKNFLKKNLVNTTGKNIPTSQPGGKKEETPESTEGTSTAQ